MNYHWPLPASCRPDFAKALVIDAVLLEFDGPQIISWTSPDRRSVLGIAADTGAASTRWLEVPLAADAWVRVLAGEQELHELFSRNPFFVVDRNDELEVVAAWELQPGELPLDVLPSPGALLPDSITESLRALAVLRFPDSASSIQDRAWFDVEVERGTTAPPRKAA